MCDNPSKLDGSLSNDEKRVAPPETWNLLAPPFFLGMCSQQWDRFPRYSIFFGEMSTFIRRSTVSMVEMSHGVCQCSILYERSGLLPLLCGCSTVTMIWERAVKPTWSWVCNVKLRINDVLPTAAHFFHTRQSFVFRGAACSSRCACQRTLLVASGGF